MDAPNGRAEWNGFKPSELLLAALLGCAGVDFTSILAKQRQVVTSVSASVRGQQDADPPWAFRHIDVVFTVRGTNLNPGAVERALTLAVERYCSVGATLAGTATITHRVIIEPSTTSAVAA
jgi:putative redox protein